MRRISASGPRDATTEVAVVVLDSCSNLLVVRQRSRSHHDFFRHTGCTADAASEERRAGSGQKTFYANCNVGAV
jgi:hypothetical protein